MFSQDVDESDEAFYLLMDQFLEDNTLSEISSLSDPSLDPNLDNSNRLIPSIKPDLTKKKRRSTKRRTNNPKFMPEIRIFRRDIRRRYGEMFNNVLNSYDLELHRRFFEEFANPNLTQVLKFFPVDLIEKLNREPRVEGIDSLLEVFGKEYMAVPDIAFQVSNVKVCQSLNTSGSKIVATLIVRGTMLYSISPTQTPIQDNNQQSNSDKVDTGNLLAASSRSHDLIVLKPLDEQIDYLIEGTVTLSLDDQHRFVSICIEAEKVDQYQREIQLIQYQ